MNLQVYRGVALGVDGFSFIILQIICIVIKQMIIMMTATVIYVNQEPFRLRNGWLSVVLVYFV